MRASRRRRIQPSLRWSLEHGTKIAHRFWITAWWHAFRLNHFRPDGRTDRHPYPCWWGQWYYDGETFPKHWHVGRPVKGDPRRGYDTPYPGKPHA